MPFLYDNLPSKVFCPSLFWKNKGKTCQTYQHKVTMTVEQLLHNNSIQVNLTISEPYPTQAQGLNSVHQKGLKKGLAYHLDCLGLLAKIKVQTHANGTQALTSLFVSAYAAISVKTFPSIPVRCEIGSIIAPTDKSMHRTVPRWVDKIKRANATSTTNGQNNKVKTHKPQRFLVQH